MKRSELVKRVEDFLDDLLLECEIDEVEAVAGQIEQIVSEYLEYGLAMQAQINKEKGKQS